MVISKLTLDKSTAVELKYLLRSSMVLNIVDKSELFRASGSPAPNIFACTARLSLASDSPAPTDSIGLACKYPIDVDSCSTLLAAADATRDFGAAKRSTHSASDYSS